ncbi:MAG: AbrB/MazE/SpoVT family DNA-binding domain-containing protein [Candidatus Hodarchaeota archaeon]
MKKPHAEKIREAVTDLGPASPNEIMDWIRKHYPSDEVNPQSYRADIIGCSRNHSSQHHYPGMPKFLWFEEETKKYRLASPKESAKIGSIEKKNQPFFDPIQGLIDGIAVAKISVTGQVAIPTVVREKLGFKPGDLLAFVINNNVLEVRKAKIKLEVE